MPSASLFAAFGAAPSLVLGVLSVLYLLASLYVYISLIHQISARTPNTAGADAPARSFGLPEAILAALLILFLLLNIGASVSQPSIQFNARNLLGNFLLTAFVVLFVVTFLHLRGFDVGALGGFFRVSFARTLSTGAILLFFAYPLILLSDAITQRLFGGGSSKQNIVEFFSGSRTIEQRMMIIFYLRCTQALFRPSSGHHIQRAVVCSSPRAFALIRAIVRPGKLFRDCLRMERFDPGLHDNAFALQFANPHRSGVSGDFFSMKLRDLREDRLLDQLLSRLPRGKSVVAGMGDDCAVVETMNRDSFLVLKTDCVVEGVHFFWGTNARDVGWKAMMRPLSDFAATSALPEFALITLMVPEQTEVRWMKELYRGLRRAAKRFQVSIVGGETSSTPGPIAISVSVIGFVEKRRTISRRGGKPGDDLFVTGRLGRSLEKKHLQFIPRIVESRWLTDNFSIHAMMDLSDGLGTDLPRLARASKVGFKIDTKKLPLTRGANINDAISEGEDYELLFAISPRYNDRLVRSWRRKFPNLPLTRIGSLNRKSKIENRKLPGGYVHFQQSD